MFPCQKYFSKEVTERLRTSERIFVCGMSLAMCNVLSWLRQISVKRAAVCDPLFEANPHITVFKGWEVCRWEEAVETRNACYILTEFSDEARRRDREAIHSHHPDSLVVDVDARREVRLEASGLCNLRCMSCQCGNYDPAYFSFQGRGFLKPELCSRILDKLMLDYPDNMGVFYYIFGEPFLNPDLDKLIALARQRGLSVCVSSNFSFQKDIQRILRAEPDILKVSVSGYRQEVYQRHHNGGRAAHVYRNLETLHQYLSSNASDTSVVVGYHIYKDNPGADMARVGDICREYGFLFAPVRAIYNNPLKRMGLSPLTEQDLRFLRECYDDPEQQMACEITHKNARFACRNLRDKLFLDYDGTVMLCELLHRDTVYRNYLDVSREEIHDWRSSHEMCRICMAHGMHLV